MGRKKIDIDVEILQKKTDISVFSSNKPKISDLIRKRKFLIIGSPATNDYEVVKAFIDGGIDIVKLHLNMVHPVSKKKIGSFDEQKDKILSLVNEYPNILWGLVAGNILTNPKDFEEIDFLELSAYFDFIDLFYSSYTLHYLSMKIDKMVAIDRLLSESELRFLGKYKFFSIEAAIVPKNFYGLPLTLEDIINYRTLIELTDIPVFIPTQKLIKPSDIDFLYSIGAKGIVLGQVATSFNIETIKKTVNTFMKKINKL